MYINIIKGALYTYFSLSLSQFQLKPSILEQEEKTLCVFVCVGELNCEHKEL